jgi:hypothetical protein
MSSSRLNPIGSSGAPRGAVADALLVLLATILLLLAIVPAAANERLSLYAYRDTRSLVALVEDAASLLERKGEQAFKDFGQKDSKWLNEDSYFFVYALDGTCLFHPITPELIGQNVMALRDINGKPIIRLITDVGRKPEKNAHGWVFYLWQNETQLTPSWKSTYVRKVVGSNGQTYVIGSGSFTIKVEKLFVEERVRLAADLVKSAGKDAAFNSRTRPRRSCFSIRTSSFSTSTAARWWIRRFRPWRGATSPSSRTPSAFAPSKKC